MLELNQRRILVNNWHVLPIEKIYQELLTSKAGLTSEEARKRRRRYGPNEISSSKKRSVFLIFLEQFKSPLIYILIAAAILTYFLKHTVDTWVILAVVFFNAFFGLLHEKKAERAMEALSKLMALKSKVKRDGILSDLASSELVPGDIVEVTSGIRIPADLRIIEGEDLRIDESMLTGESVAQEKNPGVLNYKVSLGDRTNMLFGGTVVASGRGWGVVVETGLRTEFGKIAQEVAQTLESKTPLQARLARFSKIYLTVILSAVLLIFIVGLFKRLEVLQMFLTSLSAAISAIPEGLPAVITVALANGAFQMAKRKAIIRKLIAVETLGSVTVIASDKTGTLTHNQMTIRRIYSAKNRQIFDISGSGYEPKGEIIPKPSRDLIDFLKFSVLSSDAEIFEENREWGITGDPTEGAFITAAGKVNLAKEELEGTFRRLDEIAFETKRGYMATLQKGNQKNILIVKGAPEKILAMTALGEEEREKITGVIEDFSRKALRVIGLATKEVSVQRSEISESDLTGLTFLGLAGMIDPPRKEAVEAIKICQESGIRPIMITGDYCLTAQAVAKDLGLIGDRDGAVSGQDLEDMTVEEFRDTLKRVSVFARITPEMKLKIVSSLQNQGEVVAVTGDGINDAPALKKADIGIAMGEGGTDASREVADLVLADNNFTTIIAAVEEGRTIFQNIRRVIFYLLSTSAGELFIIFYAIIFYLPPFNLPLLPVQILWLNLVTDGTAGLALAFEPTHPGVLKFKPPALKDNILSNLIIWRIVLVGLVMLAGTLFLYSEAIEAGADIVRARTIAFTTMVTFQVFNVLNSRSLKESIFKMPIFSNKYILGSMLLSFLLSYLTVAFPFMRLLFHTTMLSFLDWLKIVLVSLTVIFAIELEKYLRRKTHARY